MTAEEKLKELYKKQYGVGGSWWNSRHNIVCKKGINITAEDIDLIANLVIERMKNGTNSPIFIT